MEPSEYGRIYRLESFFWWYVGLHEFICHTLTDLGYGSTHHLLDAGCGTGGLLRCLAASPRLTGIDASSVALSFCKKTPPCVFAQGSVSALPFKNSRFDYLVSIDVLYHSGVESDLGALKEFYRALKPGGIMIVHVPAFEFLRGAHDKAVHTRHRYHKKELRNIVSKAGFTVIRISYRNFFLFPLMALKRISDSSRNADSDLKKNPPVLNYLFLLCLRMENALLKKVDLPWGSSLFCIARKPHN